MKREVITQKQRLHNKEIATKVDNLKQGMRRKITIRIP